MPFLSNVTILSGTGLISAFTTVVLITSLYCRCLKHFQASYEQDQTGDLSYGFWLHHYQIDKEIADYSTNLLGHVDSQVRLDEPLALCSNMNMCAVNICLHCGGYSIESTATPIEGLSHFVFLSFQENMPG